MYKNNDIDDLNVFINHSVNVFWLENELANNINVFVNHFVNDFVNDFANDLPVVTVIINDFVNWGYLQPFCKGETKNSPDEESSGGGGAP